MLFKPVGKVSKCKLCGMVLPKGIGAQRCPDCGYLQIDRTNDYTDIQKEGLMINNSETTSYEREDLIAEIPSGTLFGTLKVEGQTYEVYLADCQGYITTEGIYGNNIRQGTSTTIKHKFVLMER